MLHADEAGLRSMGVGAPSEPPIGGRRCCAGSSRVSRADMEGEEELELELEGGSFFQKTRPVTCVHGCVGGCVSVGASRRGHVRGTRPLMNP